jgi:hypothetical protein
MDQVVRSVRFAGVAAVGGLTLLAGAALVWYYVQPETLPLLATWQLGGILGAFVLPVLCFAVWQADRKVSAAAPVRRENRPAALRQPAVAPTPLVAAPELLPEIPTRKELIDPLPAKGSGRLGHRPRRIRSTRVVRTPAHRHRRFADV